MRRAWWRSLNPFRWSDEPVWHKPAHRIRHVTLIRYVVPFVVALTIALGILSVWRPESFRLTGTLVARSVALRLDPAAADGLVADTSLDFAPSRRATSNRVRVEVDAVAGTLPGIEGFKPGSTVELDASSLGLSALSVARGGTLRITLERYSHLLRLEATGGASFTLVVGDTGTVRFGTPARALDAGILTLRSDPALPVPMTLRARLGNRLPKVSADSDDDPLLALADIPVHGLRFGRERTETAVDPFVSSIESGKVTIVATGDTRTLDTGAPLSMTGFRGTVVNLELGRDGLHLTFAGEARDVELGPVSFPRSAKPSWLDVLSHLAWVRALVTVLLSMSCAFVGLILYEDKDAKP